MGRPSRPVDRNPPPLSGKPILGLPCAHPCSLRETLLPPGLPWGPGQAGAVPPQRRQRGQDPTAPAHPMLLAPPHPQHSPQQTRTQTAGQVSRPGRGRGSRRPCTSFPAFSRGAGRALPEWPHQTLSSGPAESGRSTPGT